MLIEFTELPIEISQLIEEYRKGQWIIDHRKMWFEDHVHIYLNVLMELEDNTLEIRQPLNLIAKGRKVELANKKKFIDAKIANKWTENIHFYYGLDNITHIDFSYPLEKIKIWGWK